MRAVSLSQILVARDRRAAAHLAALARCAKPLLSITVVMPGPVKNGRTARTLLEAAVKEVDSACTTNAWRVIERKVEFLSTGPEAMFVLDVDTQQLKTAAVEIETRHPLGRLWDLDVTAANGNRISRGDLGIPPRRCLLCTSPAHECSRSRKHPLRELIRTIKDRVDTFDRSLT